MLHTVQNRSKKCLINILIDNIKNTRVSTHANRNVTRCLDWHFYESSPTSDTWLVWSHSFKSSGASRHACGAVCADRPCNRTKAIQTREFNVPMCYSFAHYVVSIISIRSSNWYSLCVVPWCMFKMDIVHLLDMSAINDQCTLF